MDWPFMSVHHWGENPVGTWILEVHNDAFSKWASEAKFHKWGLELHGIRYDPNSEEYEKNQRFNVVREASEPSPSTNVTSGEEDASSSSPTATKPSSKSASSSTVVAVDASLDRGCVSKRLHCTKDPSRCRTFTHRNVADVLCRCLPNCVEVASLAASPPRITSTFNLQCDMSAEGEEGDSNPARRTDDETEASAADRPFYCRFIPFFSL